MHRIRLLLIAVISFLTVTNTGFIKRLISLLLCGVLSFNSSVCYGLWSESGDRANATQPPSNLSQQAELSNAIAQIPRVRQQNQSSDDQPSESNVYPTTNSSAESLEDPSAKQPQSTVSKSSLFTKSFKQISDDTAELRLINPDGCNFITTFRRMQDGTYRESIRFVPRSVEACQLEPFTAEIAPDGNKLELQLENSGESLIVEKVDANYVRETFRDAKGKQTTEKIRIPEELKSLIEKKPLELPFNVQGILKTGDAAFSDDRLYDEYIFRGQANQPIQITLESQAFDTYLALYSSDGQTKIAENNDSTPNNRNSTITISVSQSGTYRLIVTAGKVSGRGKYALSTSQVPSKTSSNRRPQVIVSIPSKQPETPQSKVPKQQPSSPKPSAQRSPKHPLAKQPPKGESKPPAIPQPTEPNVPEEQTEIPTPQITPPAASQSSKQVPSPPPSTGQAPSISQNPSPYNSPLPPKIPQLPQSKHEASCLLAKAGEKICNNTPLLAMVSDIVPHPGARLGLKLVSIVTGLVCAELYGSLPPLLFDPSDDFITSVEKEGAPKSFAKFTRGFKVAASLLNMKDKIIYTGEVFYQAFTGEEADWFSIKKTIPGSWQGRLSDFLKACNQSPEQVANKPPNFGKQKQGTSYGDPHLITFDGFRYSFQTVGEFVLAKSTDGSFEVQTRQAPVNQSLSLNSAVAMRVGGDRVAFYSKDFPDGNTGTPLRVDGRPVVVEGKSLTLPSGGTIFKNNDSNYVVQWASGEKVALNIYSRGKFQYMDVFPFVFESQANQLVGLMGNANGDISDDLRFRTGKAMPSKSTYGNLRQLLERVIPIRLPLGEAEKLYFEKLSKDFGNDWRVSSEESLFDYASGRSTASFTNRAFPDAYLTLDMLSAAQLQNASAACQSAGVPADLIEGCIFDVGFTGYNEFAYRTAQVFKVINVLESVIPGFKNPIQQILQKIPKLPKIPGLPFFK